MNCAPLLSRLGRNLKMIRYTLSCSNKHDFDSWFQSAEAYERLCATGMVACTSCGSNEVAKALMAPSVRGTRETAEDARPGQSVNPLSTPTTPEEKAIDALRRHIAKNSEYVGLAFAAEARAMHDGDVPERSIYGEAPPDEAMRLVQDGIPVSLLPFIPTRKSH